MICASDVDSTSASISTAGLFLHGPFHDGWRRSVHCLLKEAVCERILHIHWCYYLCVVTKVFDMDATQSDIYDFVRQSGVIDVLQGLNCCCVAYGLSGSGKSYTMLGDLPDLWDRLDVKSSEYRWCSQLCCSCLLANHVT